MLPLAEEALYKLRTPVTTRRRAQALYALAVQGELDHFTLYEDKLDETSDFVSEVISQSYPDLNIPYHSRWRHFTADSNDLWQHFFNDHLASLSTEDQLNASLDFVTISVLLDAGAGQNWFFKDSQTGLSLNRSEGLAIASLRMFEKGLFSSNPDFPYQVDGSALQNLKVEKLSTGFQHSTHNPLIGIEARCRNLQALGQSLCQAFPDHQKPRISLLKPEIKKNSFSALAILHSFLDLLYPITTEDIIQKRTLLGDIGHHSKLQSDNSYLNGYIPFHKLLQWLTYSWIDSLENSGLTCIDIDDLTGLPEYRNGGLFLQKGVLQPKQDEIYLQTYTEGDEMIVEWRALTIILLDKLCTHVRQKLSLSPSQFKLPNLLEGGSWKAGRILAFQNNPNGNPPIKLKTQGIIF